MTKARDLARLGVSSSGVLADANAPSGSVIQVVSVTKTNTFSLSSLTFTDVTDLSLSITPISTSSKILVMASVAVASSGDFAYLRLVRDSTPIYIGDAASSRPRVSGAIVYTAGENPYNCEPVQMTHLDSPATTSTLTYKVQLRSGSSAFAVYVNRTSDDRDTANYEPRLASSITLMEIAG